MGYKAGTLDLEVLGANGGVVSSIKKTASALDSLNNALKNMTGVNYGTQVNKLSRFFDKLSLSINSFDGDKLKSISSIGKAFGSISSISSLDKMDFNKVSKGFSTLTKGITPFIDKVKEAETSLVSLESILKKTGKSGKADSIIPGGKFDFSKLGKRIFSLSTIKKLGNELNSIVKYASDYEETLNLWQIAMMENNEEAEKFVSTMSKAYGISTSTLMNAQATFKNMLGSLGQISSDTAYQISEALVAMSVDFASLYNTGIDEAFTKMESMLAGQVRPIRSAGLDITENTLYMYYQQLGGTKTIRQLNRTEKQLLAILAVYKQMEAAGATGDMANTLEHWANQARLTKEYFSELKTWTGLIVKDALETSGVLTYINVLLITATTVIKSIAKSKGLGNDNFIEGMFETVEATNDEVDELQEKLLDFDKIRALDDTQSSDTISIDEALLSALGNYTSGMSNIQSSSQEIANSWLTMLGLTQDANGEWEISEDKVNKISNAFKALGISVGVIVGYNLFSWLVKAAEGTALLKGAMTALNGVLIGGAIYYFLQAADAFNKGDIAAGGFATAVGVTLVGAFILLNKKAIASILPSLNKLIIKIDNTTSALNRMSVAGGVLMIALVAAYAVFENWSDMNTAQKIVAVCGVVAVAILGLAIAMGAFHSAWSLGLAAVGIVAGVVAVTAAITSAKKSMSEPVKFAVGASDIDSGTLFVAGEAGKTEAVYEGSNGKTNVANIQQMQTAYLNALNSWWSNAKNDVPQFQGVSDSGIYSIVKREAKRNGKTLSKVR